MDDCHTIAGDLVDRPPQESNCLGAGRWPEDSVEAVRFPSMGIARNGQELLKVGRLRYELFIERDGKKYAHADHRTRIFLEPIDRVSLNFQACDHQRCLAAVRMTWAEDALADEHLTLAVQCSGLPDHEIAKTVLNSRLVIRPEMRARFYLTELFRTVYRSGYRNKARNCLVAARPELADLYIRFGFIDLGARYIDPIGGQMAIVKLDLHDRPHLESRNSPLIAIFDELNPRH